MGKLANKTHINISDYMYNTHNYWYAGKILQIYFISELMFIVHVRSKTTGTNT